MTILDAIRDPQLFGRWFAEPTWRRWFVALAAIFALPIERLAAFGLEADEVLDIYKQHTQRETWPALPMRKFWGLMGRRGGKSRVMALRGGVLRVLSHVSPGRGRARRGDAAGQRQATGPCAAPLHRGVPSAHADARADGDARDGRDDRPHERHQH